MDKIRESLDILWADIKYDLDACEQIPTVETAKLQYDELLAYVRWLEIMAVPGAKDQFMQYRPEWIPEWLPQYKRSDGDE